jgi:tRNA threonylcarbamoyladenosine biosynthesis protein TsaB
MAYFLYIDTSGSTATVAISDTVQVLQIIQHHNAQEQAAVINTMIGRVLTQAGLELTDIDAFALSAGPGSYTGLRVGISVVKGLAFALDKPILLFNVLDIIHASLPTGNNAIVLKARMGECFIATYRNGVVDIAPQHAFNVDLATFIQPDFQVYTDDITALEPLNIERLQIHAVDVNKAIVMEDWRPLVVKRFELQDFDDLAYSEPFYLKAAYTTTPKKI